MEKYFWATSRQCKQLGPDGASLPVLAKCRQCMVSSNNETIQRYKLKLKAITIKFYMATGMNPYKPCPQEEFSHFSFLG